MYNSKYSLGSRVQSARAKSGKSQPTGDPLSYGRVETVILDESTELYDNEGNRLPIGGIRYKLVTEASDTNENYYYALPLFGNIQQFPFVNEIVTLLNVPDPNTQVANDRKVKYYLNSGVINIWGTPHHNALPGAGVDFNYPIGNSVKELSDVNPLYPFPGDVLIEGRHGQSVRIGGTKSKMNPLVDAANDGMPYLIISNGQIKTDNGIDRIVENIDKDPNSMYFVSDHTVPLTPANNKRASYTLPPTYAKAYRGNQVLINGGRLFFNAKEESILLSAKDSVGVNATTVNLDATDYLCVDAKEIFLGAGARSATFIKQPVILGNQLDRWLNDLLDLILHLGYACESASTEDKQSIASINMVASELIKESNNLRARMTAGEFKSAKVYTE